MRKRTSKPPRFAAVDNKAIDTLPSILAIGLLTRLIRARDGEEVTVEKLARAYAEGEDSLTRAMQALVEAANVVKFKVQRAASEEVEEPDGSVSKKRGGSWWTTFSVDSVPFTAEDVAAMVVEIRAQGNVRAIRVEPPRLDPDPGRRALPPVARQAKKRAPKAPNPPTPGNPGVGPTCDDAPSESGNESRPTPGFPGVGRPTPGQGGAHNYRKTEEQKTANEPPVPPSIPDRGARASDGNRPNGWTDGGEIEQQDRAVAGEPMAGAKTSTSPAAPVASDGVAVLIEAARRYERAAMPGDLLYQLGLHVEGLLAAGWTWSQLMPLITAPLPDPSKVRTTDAAMTAARIRSIPMSPPALPGAAAASIPGQAAPRPSPEAPQPFRPPCPGADDRPCGRPINTPGAARCAACENPCPSGCGQASNSARLDKLCHACGERADDERLSRCAACGKQPATRVSGLCGPCHRIHRTAEGEDQDQTATEDVDIEEACIALGLMHRHGAIRHGGCIEGVNGCPSDAVWDGRCNDCHDIWTGHQEYLDLLAPAYAGQEATPPPS